MKQHRCRFAFLAFLVLAGPVEAETLQDRVAKLPPADIFSENSLDALSLCIALGLSEWINPVSLRGDKRVLIYGMPPVQSFSPTYFVVSIDDLGARRSLSVQSHPTYAGKARTIMTKCASTG